MLRNLRLRRRHRYGTYIGAVVSALFLLLSVSVLYNRLSYSHFHTPFHYLRHNPNKRYTLFDSLITDSDDFNDVSTVDEDRIDELDIVDEDDSSKASNDEDFEDEEEQSDQVKASGFFFDHLSGAIRRNFGKNKRSIEHWGDENLGFTVDLGLEDPSKTAFGSDDVAVDEEVRRKASEVAGIEDALLLKVGSRVSPLRKGWGDWFDKKGDFLKRDKMFKSNLEVLNPLNNPLLQDPDGVGATGLTRGDKIVQKWWLNEFRRVPFVVKKPLGVLESARETAGSYDANVNKNDGEMRSRIKREEQRRTLKENISNVEGGSAMSRSLEENAVNGLRKKKVANSFDALKNLTTDENSSYKSQVDEQIRDERVEHVREVDNFGGTKNGDSKIQVKSEYFSYIYADGKRWGYYPGLDPNLSFSSFMDEFLSKEKCDMRVFMVWNSPPWMYSVRNQRGLESLLYHHRDACVVVYSETIELDFFRDNFVKDGYKVAVAMPNLDELLKDTPTHVFASVWFEWRKTKFYSTHYSELVRLAALYKYGGIYLDSDIIILNPISSLNDSVGMEDDLSGSSLNGAVMAFRRHSSFLMECLKEFYMTYDDARWRWNGAQLLTRVAKRISRKRIELKLQPSFSFFPISSRNITRYFSAPKTETEKADHEALFKKIVNQSLTFHFWNNLTSSLVPELGSLVSRLIDYRCIRCFDVL